MESDKERIFKICEDVLGKARRERWKCQLSEETAKKIEDRRTVKKKLYGEDGNQRKDASAKYQEDCREVKRVCRTDKRDYANNLAAEAKTAARLGD